MRTPPAPPTPCRLSGSGLGTFVPIAASWHALPRAGTKPEGRLPGQPSSTARLPSTLLSPAERWAPSLGTMALRPTGGQSDPESSVVEHRRVSQWYPCCGHHHTCSFTGLGYPSSEVSARTCQRSRICKGDAHPVAGMGHLRHCPYRGHCPPALVLLHGAYLRQALWAHPRARCGQLQSMPLAGHLVHCPAPQDSAALLLGWRGSGELMLWLGTTGVGIRTWGQLWHVLMPALPCELPTLPSASWTQQ